MCLSTVYKNEKRDDTVLCTYVSAIRAEGEDLIFTDIMGNSTTIRGRLVAADLTAGTVIVAAQ